MKNKLLIVLLFNLVVPIWAMEGQKPSPWYQAYKDPQAREKVIHTLRDTAFHGWKKAKYLAKKYKWQIGIAAVLLGIGAVTVHAKNIVADTYIRNDLDLTKYNMSVSNKILLVGVSVYQQRFLLKSSMKLKEKLINDLQFSDAFRQLSFPDRGRLLNAINELID